MDIPPALIASATRTDSIHSADRRCEGEYQRLRRGMYLSVTQFPDGLKSWEVRRLVTLARAHAVMASAKDPSSVVFTGEVGLIVRGLGTWHSAPDIVFRKQPPSGRRRIVAPAVQIGGILVPEVAERCLRSAPADSEKEQVGEFTCATLIDTTLDLIRCEHPVVAVVGASSALRRLCGFGPFDIEASREREAEVQEQLLAAVSRLPQNSQSHKMRRMLDSLDAGVESPGEAILVWLLRLLLPRDRVVTQHWVEVKSYRFRLDIAIAETKIVIEFDGGTKLTILGSSATDFLKRHKLLSEAGFDLIRVDSSELNDLQMLLHRLADELKNRGIFVRDIGPFPVPARVMESQRRF